MRRNSLEVLVATMHQTDFSKIEEMNIRCDVILANQAGRNDYEEQEFNGYRARMITTDQRGVGRNRNLALERAEGDICLLCDDDEELLSGAERTILDAYRSVPEADIIVFGVRNLGHRLGDKPRRLKMLELFRVSSVQISFRRKAVQGKLAFDTKLGAGTGNGSGEETKFLLDCRQMGLKIYYCPEEIAVLHTSGSTWFSGFDESYFYLRGMTTRYIMGMPLALTYGAYFLLTKRGLYGEEVSMKEAAANLLKGIFENRLGQAEK